MGKQKYLEMIVPLHTLNFCAREVKLLARRHSIKFTQEKEGSKWQNVKQL